MDDMTKLGFIVLTGITIIPFFEYLNKTKKKRAAIVPKQDYIEMKNDERAKIYAKFGVNLDLLPYQHDQSLYQKKNERSSRGAINDIINNVTESLKEFNAIAKGITSRFIPSIGYTPVCTALISGNQIINVPVKATTDEEVDYEKNIKYKGLSSRCVKKENVFLEEAKFYDKDKYTLTTIAFNP